MRRLSRAETEVGSSLRRTITISTTVSRTFFSLASHTVLEIVLEVVRFMTR